jgi:hypothetical protein
MHKRRTTSSSLEFITEVADLVVGLGILMFALAPMALPALALTALLAALLLVPALIIGAAFAAPVLAIRHWWRSRGRAKPAVLSPAARRGSGSRAGVVADVSRPMREKL